MPRFANTGQVDTIFGKTGETGVLFHIPAGPFDYFSPSIRGDIYITKEVEVP